MAETYRSAKKIDFEVSLLEWLKEEYPEVAISTIMNGLLRSFKEIHDDTGVTMRKVMRDSAKEVKEKLDESVTL